jgi:DNA invertase Pin-like site-specific DNA recombinase
MARGRFISYLRVSTERQGRSGLGLEAQRQAVETFLNGGDWNIVAEVVEVESGKRNDRPKLKEALRLCRVHKAQLLIAKLDRLARNVAFVSNLMESGVEFTACDFPQANRLTVHILAAVAEHEAKAISDRTKAALHAAKRRGKVLGGFKGVLPSAADRKAALAVRRGHAADRARDLEPIVSEIRLAGVKSLNGIAKELTSRAVPPARGGLSWSATQVKKLLAHFDA